MTANDRMFVPIFVALVALIGVLPAQAARADEHDTGHPAWSYSGPTGPEHWKDVGPEAAVCGLGKHQSPIDIRDPVRSHLSPIEFHYAVSPLRVIDNGHTIMVSYASGSSIVVDGESYELQQFHFHKPSEEHLNGRGFPLVVHLVHKNAQGKLAVIAVLMKVGAPNTLLAAVWAHLPATRNVESAPSGVSVDASELLPLKRGYYTFTGSLTTPPCTEDVTWFVLKTPGELSASQLMVFGNRYAHNARPVQPLNDRVVRESTD